MFVLQLNPMTGNFEQLVPVARAETVEQLKAWVETMRVPRYSDEDGTNMCGGKLYKSFKKGSALEYLNPPDRAECIVDAGTEDSWAAAARQRYQAQVLSLMSV